MIIIHDFFIQNGGGENLVLSLAKELKIKIITAFNTKKKYNLIKQSRLNFFLKRSKLLVYLYYNFIFKVKVDDIIIFSGNHCCFSILKCKARKKILYAHSLPKSLFADLYMDHNKSLFTSFFKDIHIKQYIKNLYSLDKIIFNSNKTKLKFLHVFKDLEKKVDMEVIYPFSDIDFKEKKIANLKKNKYFVINSRHQHYKNIHHILLLLIPFLKKNKDIKIFITQEGELTENLVISHNQSNQIKFTGYLNFNDYQSLLLNSVGIIFPSRDEDFGIAALDAYNLSIPVIIQRNCGFSEILPNNYSYFYNDMNLISIIERLLSDTDNKSIFYKNKLNYKKLFLSRINNLS